MLVVEFYEIKNCVQLQLMTLFFNLRKDTQFFHFRRYQVFIFSANKYKDKNF